jgi:hypothetical protein
MQNTQRTWIYSDCNSITKVKVADIEFNKNEIIAQIKIANKKQCQIILFRNLLLQAIPVAIYSFKNTLLKKSLAAVKEIALVTEKLGCIVFWAHHLSQIICCLIVLSFLQMEKYKELFQNIHSQYQ